MSTGLQNHSSIKTDCVRLCSRLAPRTILSWWPLQAAVTMALVVLVIPTVGGASIREPRSAESRWRDPCGGSRAIELPAYLYSQEQPSESEFDEVEAFRDVYEKVLQVIDDVKDLKDQYSRKIDNVHVIAALQSTTLEGLPFVRDLAIDTILEQNIPKEELVKMSYNHLDTMVIFLNFSRGEELRHNSHEDDSLAEELGIIEVESLHVMCKLYQLQYEWRMAESVPDTQTRVTELWGHWQTYNNANRYHPAYILLHHHESLLQDVHRAFLLLSKEVDG